MLGQAFRPGYVAPLSIPSRGCLGTCIRLGRRAGLGQLLLVGTVRRRVLILAGRGRRLTDRAPIRISETIWPRIAYASRHDGEVECQANREWHLTVRQHADGRAIVYGTESAGMGGCRRGYEAARAGVILDAGEDIVSAIRSVGERARCSSAMIDAVIADLPAIDLV